MHPSIIGATSAGITGVLTKAMMQSQRSRSTSATAGSLKQSCHSER